MSETKPAQMSAEESQYDIFNLRNDIARVMGVESAALRVFDDETRRHADVLDQLSAMTKYNFFQAKEIVRLNNLLAVTGSDGTEVNREAE